MKAIDLIFMKKLMVETECIRAYVFLFKYHCIDYFLHLSKLHYTIQIRFLGGIKTSAIIFNVVIPLNWAQIRKKKPLLL